MTAQDLIEILSALPPDTTVTIDSGSGLEDICYVDSRVADLEDDNGERTQVFILSQCFCNYDEEEFEAMVESGAFVEDVKANLNEISRN